MFCAHCGKPNADGARHCSSCGGLIGGEPVVRRGRDFIVRKHATLPPYCVKCGSPARPEPLKSTFHWHDPLLYLTIFAGCIVYVIVALIVRKRFDLDVPLCDEHFGKRRGFRTVGLAMVLAAIPAMAVGVVANRAEWAVLLGLGSFLVGIVLVVVTGSILKPVKITDDFAVFRGAGEPFLGQLPQGTA